MTLTPSKLVPSPSLEHAPEPAAGGPSSLPPSREVVTRGEASLPAAWLERLLGAACAAAPDAGVEATAGAFLAVVAELLPEYACAIFVPDADHYGASRVLVAGASHAQPPAARQSGGIRLFPSRVDELVVSVDDGSGATLHAAHDGGAPLNGGSLEARFFQRLATSLAGSLRRARVAETARAQAAELTALHEQVIQSEKLASLGQIAAGVVHELNNPLSSIVAYSDYLRRKAERGVVGPDDVERLRRISEAADRILRFSRDLVAYARPSSGVTERVMLHDIVDQALGFCEHLLSRSNISVDRDFAASLPPVRGVGGELTQVFVNLVTNACHAMPDENGHLVVRTVVDGDAVRVHVIDNGHGIDARHIGKVFEPFFTTKSEGRGTGLGLSIVRNIILRHGGSIRVESEIDLGTQFVIVLPAATS